VADIRPEDHRPHHPMSGVSMAPHSGIFAMVALVSLDQYLPLVVPLEHNLPVVHPRVRLHFGPLPAEHYW
jgi:hypothetical protein